MKLLSPPDTRLDYLDATRAFALVLGIVFHASVSFVPVFMGWAVQDISTSPLAGVFFVVSHSFRLEVFFLLAGFFARGAWHRHGMRHFAVTRVIRIGVPFVVGWFVLRPLLVSGWIMGMASMRGDFDFWVGIRGGAESLKGLPAGLFTGTHLWFLHYLALITALVLVGRMIVLKTGSWSGWLMGRADAAVAWLADSRFAFLWLVGPTALILWGMRGWGVDTPDQGLRPQAPVLLLYGGFYVLGWLCNRQREVIARFARLPVSRWMLAGLGMAGVLLLGGIERDAGHPHRTAAHVGFAVSYALMMWTLVLLVIGVFRKICDRPNAVIRYIADSSYWLYLVHLPIVIWLQVAVAEVALHWSLKLVFISGVAVGVSLLGYELFVRSTLVGWVLNGKRGERVIFRWGAGK